MVVVRHEMITPPHKWVKLHPEHPGVWIMWIGKFDLTDSDGWRPW